jgi:hypothetical protein
MRCKVHFFLLNDDFSQEYADMHYAGKESEMNRRFEWEDELGITADVSKWNELTSTEVPIAGVLPDGEQFEEILPNMRSIELFEGDTLVARLAASEILIDRIQYEENGDDLAISVYLKDKEPLSNPVPGIYIAARDFPERLIFE